MMVRKQTLLEQASFVLLAVGCGVALSATGARAQTLAETLATTYNTSPQLQADRARQRSFDSDLARAYGGYRPTATLQMEAGRGRDAFRYNYITPHQRIPNSDKQWESNTPRTSVLQVIQPIYDGGKTSADVEHGQLAIQQGRQQLRSTEQSVLGDAVQAYYDLYRDQQIADLTKASVTRLRKQRDDTITRYKVNDVTQTDVAQTEARLARGLADQTAAEGNVIASQSAFTRASGIVPGALPPPPALPALPGTLEEALGQAEENSPDLKSAEFTAKVAAVDVDYVSSGLNPSVALRAMDRRDIESSQRSVIDKSQQVVLSLTVPIYEGGVAAARTREQKHVAGQRRLEADVTRRRVIDQTRRAWQGLTTSRSRIVSINEQLKAATVALDSIRAEVRVGTRTIYDQLNAEQDLLDAQTAMARAQHDEAIGGYSLLVSLGRLNVRELGVPVEPYDPGQHNQEESGRWFGTGILKDYDKDHPEKR